MGGADAAKSESIRAMVRENETSGKATSFAHYLWFEGQKVKEEI